MKDKIILFIVNEVKYIIATFKFNKKYNRQF